MTTANDVVRKALTCLLRAQGLDVDGIAGSHKTVEEAVLSQFGQPRGPLHGLRFDIRDIRIMRHDEEYRSEVTSITRENAQDALNIVRDVRSVVVRLMPYLGVFT